MLEKHSLLDALARGRFVGGLLAALVVAGCAGVSNRANDDSARTFAPRAVPAEGEALMPDERPEKPEIAETGPVQLTVIDAVLVGLQNNRALRVQRATPAILQTREEWERAAFDPVFRAAASLSEERGQTPAGFDTRTTTLRGDAGIGQYFPSGTDIELGADARQLRGDITQNTVGIGLTVTQALLRGRGTGVNLAALRQAQVDTLRSEYELRGFAEALAAEIELTCWDYYLAERKVEIFERSLELARDQLQIAEERVRVGQVAETELAAARAEVALRREDLINARSRTEIVRLELLRLTNPRGETLWDREVILEARPEVVPTELDEIEDHVNLAMQMRPDLNEARLRVRRGDLELVRTRNGLLPKLDLFVALGMTGYAESFGAAAGRISREYYDATVGLALEFPFNNRRARSDHERARLTREQSADAVDNLEQLVQLDIRTAIIEANRTREQIAATEATREAQEEKVRAEVEKFRVGRSTSILVAAAQRDLVASQVAEIESLVNFLKALTRLYRLEGSLLLRRGIAAPGPAGPVPSVE